MERMGTTTTTHTVSTNKHYDLLQRAYNVNHSHNRSLDPRTHVFQTSAILCFCNYLLATQETPPPYARPLASASAASTSSPYGTSPHQRRCPFRDADEHRPSSPPPSPNAVPSAEPRPASLPGAPRLTPRFRTSVAVSASPRAHDPDCPD